VDHRAGLLQPVPGLGRRQRRPDPAHAHGGGQLHHPWHQSARVGATVRSPWVQTQRIDSGDPLEHILQPLDRFQPQVLIGYASMLRLLASEQLAGA
jgi:hypothetical protein